jgi:hypothetical protein
MKKFLFLILFIVVVGGMLYIVEQKRSSASNRSAAWQVVQTGKQLMPTPSVFSKGMWQDDSVKFGNDSGNLNQQITLNITKPVEATVNTAQIAISGETVPNATVYLADKEIKADAQGKFSGVVTLDEGENDIFVLAHDADGKYAEKELVVNLESQ